MPLIESVETSSSAFELAGKRVFVAGHTGMAGSAIVRRIRQEACHLILPERSELDLTRQDQTERYLSANSAGGRDHGGRPCRRNTGQ